MEILQNEIERGISFTAYKENHYILTALFFPHLFLVKVIFYNGARVIPSKPKSDHIVHHLKTFSGFLLPEAQLTSARAAPMIFYGPSSLLPPPLLMS